MAFNQEILQEMAFNHEKCRWKQTQNIIGNGDQNHENIMCQYSRARSSGISLILIPQIQSWFSHQQREVRNLVPLRF